MVISEREAKDLGITHRLIMSRFRCGKTIFIGKGEYVVTDIIDNCTGDKTYRLMKVKKYRRIRYESDISTGCRMTLN